jgi:hypothetical protein
MPDHTGTKISPRLATFMGAIMFLFGGTAGYIVRDVRADEQVLTAATEARQSAQSLAIQALQRGQLAAGTVAAGVRAAGESTAAAVGQLTHQPEPAQAADSAKQPRRSRKPS